MARPRKEGLDYFPHDTDALSDEKVEALRALYDNDGYAFYFIMLERIYRTPDGELDISDAETRQILASKVAVTPEKFDSMLQTAVKRGVFDPEAYKNGILTSDGIKKRRAPVLEKRDSMRASYKKKVVSGAETIPETPQSKAKQSKVMQRASTPVIPPIQSNTTRPVENSALPAGSNEPRGKERDSATLSNLRSTLQARLNNLGYWMDTQLCNKRLDKFLSKLQTESRSKANPIGWMIAAAPKRLQEHLDEFKLSREEMDQATG